MRDLGISGIRPGKSYRVTTHADEGQHRPADLVDRQFSAPAPNRLWVADLTYVKTYGRVSLRRFHPRRLLPHDRRLAAVHLAAL
jgi:transposase InsO family protein